MEGHVERSMGEVGLIFGISYFKCKSQLGFALALRCHPLIGRFYGGGNPSISPTALTDPTDMFGPRPTFVPVGLLNSIRQIQFFF